jgi:NADH-quinone oxidoreductase subunit H
MREAAQMVSYEIPLALAALVPVVAVGTLSLTELGRMQAGWLWNWLLFTNPFVFIAFFVYFTAATASCKRAPFDLAEAESELVAGFHTEYSGMRWSFFFMAEYAAMFLVSGVASILFLGAWHTGIGPLDAALEAARADGRAADSFYALGWLANLFGAMVFMTKATLLLCVQIWVRWTLPRLRIDQVMLTCLKYLVPITCVLFLGAVLWPLAMTQLFHRTQVLTTPFGERLHATPADAREPAEVTAVDPPANADIGHWSLDIGHSPPESAEARESTSGVPRVAQAGGAP